MRLLLTWKGMQRFGKLAAVATLMVGLAGFGRNVTMCAAVDVPKQALDLPADNPFAAPSPLPFHAPAFDKIRIEHYLATFTFAMKQQLAEMNAIASQKEAATFEKCDISKEA